MIQDLSMDSQIWHLKSKATKEKIDKLDFTKIKNFCLSQYIIKHVKKTNYRMVENIFKSFTW